ncbi:MAG: catechol 1,2-dioxygenase [Bacteroidota bacterium]
MKRRFFIKNSTLTAFSIAAYGSLNWNGKSFEADSVTTTDILGPFYRPGAPMRGNLVPAGSTAPVMHLSGTIFGADGITPLAGTLIESWQCDEHEHYDNVSDEYLFRGCVRTGKDGKYAIKTIVAVPYKDGDTWRPAHVHLRISSDGYQDLITQIYFKGDNHIKEDGSASSPLSVKRILDMSKNSSGETVVNFDVVLGKTLLLEDAAYKKISGLYQLEKGMAEFTKEDDLLILKMNGQYTETMVYKGDNSFEGGLGFNKARFELMTNGDVKTSITLWDMGPGNQKYLEIHMGLKVLKYRN